MRCACCDVEFGDGWAARSDRDGRECVRCVENGCDVMALFEEVFGD